MDTFLTILSIGAWALWTYLSYYLGKKKGYSEIWAVIFGMIFGVFAVIVYVLLPYTRKGKIAKIKEEEEIRKEALGN